MATIHEDAWFSVKIIVNDEGKIKQVQRKIECVKTYNSVSDLWEKLDLGLGYDSSNGSIPVEFFTRPKKITNIIIIFFPSSGPLVEGVFVRKTQK